VDDLRGVGPALLAFDGDEAGRRATTRATQALLASAVLVHVAAISDEKDLPDCLAARDPPRHGPWLARLLDDASRFVIENPETGLRSVRVDWFRSYVRSEVGTDAERIVRAMPTLGWTSRAVRSARHPRARSRRPTRSAGGTLQAACFVVSRSWA
jgi:hypothetical protein